MEGQLQSWDLKTGKELRRLKLHANKINRLVFSPDGMRLASASDDTTVKVLHLTPEGEIETFRGHESPVSSVAFSAGGDVIATAGWDSTIRLWDAASRQEPMSLKTPTGSRFSSVAYSPDGASLVAGGSNATAAWDASTGRILWTAPEGLSSYPAGTGKALGFDPQGRILASALENGGIQLRDARDGKTLRNLSTPRAGPCASVDFSPNGRTLLAGHVAGRIVLWNPSDGHPIREWRGHANSLTCAIFSPDGRYVASAGAESAGGNGADDQVRLWDVSSGREIRRLVGHRGVICSLAFSPDSRRIFTGGRDQMIRVWDIETGTMRHAQQGHSGDVQCLSLSPDGKRLASCSDDRTVTIWDVVTTQELQTLSPQAGAVLGVAFSPDGTRLAAACPDQAVVMVWDARPLTGELRTELNAASLLATLFPHAATKPQLLRRIREVPLIEEAARPLALEWADADWKSTRARAASAQLWHWLQKWSPPTSK